jgi:hypothetical protein
MGKAFAVDVLPEGTSPAMASIAKINTKDFQFGADVSTQGRFSFLHTPVAAPVAVREADP